MAFYREYESYESYLNHQASKLNRGIKRQKARFFPKDFNRIKEAFKDRFRFYQPYFPVQGVILCMGARLGMEVAALREMDYKAIGVDINPGPRQDPLDPLVIKGDFHHTSFESNNFSGLYINCIDHCFNLELLSKEMSRVLIPKGRLIVEIPHLGYGEKTVSMESRMRGITVMNKYESCAYKDPEDIESSLKEFQLVTKFNSIHDRIVAIYDKR